MMEQDAKGQHPDGQEAGSQISAGQFVFESREEYDRAEKEAEYICRMEQEIDLSDGENAWRVYKKLVADKTFETVVGYTFLYGLRKTIADSGVIPADALPEIPIKVTRKPWMDTLAERSAGENRFRRRYEGQLLTNHKLKIVIAALVVLLAGFVFINFRFEYSIFTYFTNYKANMEEELIDKYEYWESELEEREKNLERNGGGTDTAAPEQTPPA